MWSWSLRNADPGVGSQSKEEIRTRSRRLEEEEDDETAMTL